MQFNVPPGWPQQFQYGQPVDPGWPPAPQGWVWWVADSHHGPGSSQPRLSSGARAVGWVILGLGLLIALAATMPWASIGIFTVAGTSGDGQITLFLGLFAAGVGLARGLSTRPSGWQIALPIGALGLGLIITAVGGYDWGQISNELTSVGSGLVLTTLGGLALTAVAIVGLVKRK